MGLNLENKRFFEGWYFKQSAGDKVMCIIPGISIEKNSATAFIQIVASWMDETFFIPYDYCGFSYNEHPFKVKIGLNTFSLDGIEINISYNGHIIFGKLGFTHITPAEKCIMGPFELLPNMECSHKILSLKHDVWGSLSFDGEEINFNKGRGYIESDCGRAFPKKWLWIQANSFVKDHNCCVMAAVAQIPYAGREFSGLISVLHKDGHQERFATYNGSRIMHIEREENRIRIWIRKGRRILEISANMEKEARMLAPTQKGMDRTISEYTGDVSISLSENNKLIFEDFSENGSVEIVDF